jgi:hypothetical protein
MPEKKKAHTKNNKRKGKSSSAQAREHRKSVKEVPRKYGKSFQYNPD